MEYRAAWTTGMEFSDRRREISFQDKHSDVRYVAYNPNNRTVTKFRVDGDLIKDNESKCDYLMAAERKNPAEHPDFYFVELKGHDEKTAIRQLERSVELLICRRQVDFHSVYCRLVMSRCPNINSSNRVKLDRKMRAMRGNFLQKSRQMEETI
ncbi:MAG: hypothetical protein LBF89_01940 [Bacteroidales bacterium]|jgi:hypothetical protein|nr:hypothetical protein [Bacteroidales bacterium]